MAGPAQRAPARQVLAAQLATDVGQRRLDGLAADLGDKAALLLEQAPEQADSNLGRHGLAVAVQLERVAPAGGPVHLHRVRGHPPAFGTAELDADRDAAHVSNPLFDRPLCRA